MSYLAIWIRALCCVLSLWYHSSCVHPYDGILIADITSPTYPPRKSYPKRATTVTLHQCVHAKGTPHSAQLDHERWATGGRRSNLSTLLCRTSQNTYFWSHMCAAMAWLFKVTMKDALIKCKRVYWLRWHHGNHVKNPLADTVTSFSQHYVTFGLFHKIDGVVASELQILTELQTRLRNGAQKSIRYLTSSSRISIQNIDLNFTLNSANSKIKRIHWQEKHINNKPTSLQA